MPTTRPPSPECLFEPLWPPIAAAKEAVNDARRRWLASCPGEAVGDYPLTDADGSATSLRGLFSGRRDLLVVHNMGRSCPYCTMWADGLIGLAQHIERRAALVLSSPDPAPVLREFAKSRRWPFRCVSYHGTGFARDLGYEPEPGTFWPGVSAFHLDDQGAVHRTGTARFGPGDDFCAAWPMFELLRGGPGAFEPAV